MGAGLGPTGSTGQRKMIADRRKMLSSTSSFSNLATSILLEQKTSTILREGRFEPHTYI